MYNSNYADQIITVTMKDGTLLSGLGEVKGSGIELIDDNTLTRVKVQISEVRSLSIDDDEDNVSEAQQDVILRDVDHDLDLLADQVEQVFASIIAKCPLDDNQLLTMLTDRLTENLLSLEDNNEVSEGQA